MSTVVDQHWNRHYRALKDTTTMPLTIGLLEPVEPDPFDPEILRVEEQRITRWAKTARPVLADDEDELEEGLEPALEEEPVNFVRIAAHGVSCEVAIVLVTPEIAARYLERQCRNRHVRRSQIEFLVRELRDSRGTW